MLLALLLIPAIGFLIYVGASTSRSNAGLRRAEQVPDGPGTPEANQATLDWSIEDRAHRLYTQAAVNGQLPSIRPTAFQRWGTRALIGGVAFSLFHHSKPSDGGNGFHPWDLDSDR